MTDGLGATGAAAAGGSPSRGGVRRAPSLADGRQRCYYVFFSQATFCIRPLHIAEHVLFYVAHRQYPTAMTLCQRHKRMRTLVEVAHEYACYQWSVGKHFEARRPAKFTDRGVSLNKLTHPSPILSVVCSRVTARSRATMT